jgi:RNA polymerase sigma-70 factor (ECF subfamily)
MDPMKMPPAGEIERIYCEYAPLVYRTAWGVLGSREDAEDVLQVVFLRLLRREFPSHTLNAKAYFHTAAVNASLDMLKARRRRSALVSEVQAFPQPATADGFDEDLCQRLYEAIEQLGPKSAEIVLLHYMHKKTTAEIGRRLGVSRTVVGVRLFRARLRLRKLLSKGKSS